MTNNKERFLAMKLETLDTLLKQQQECKPLGGSGIYTPFQIQQLDALTKRIQQVLAEIKSAVKES